MSTNVVGSWGVGTFDFGADILAVGAFCKLKVCSDGFTIYSKSHGL